MGVDPISLDTTTMDFLLTRCLKITPVTMGCSSASASQVIRKMDEYQSHAPFPYRRICKQLSLPWNKVPIINFAVAMPRLLKYSIEPHFTKRGLHDFIQMDPPIFITRLPGGSAKTQPTGHRRG